MVRNVIRSEGTISFETSLMLANGETKIFSVEIDAEPTRTLDTLFRIGDAITLLAEAVQKWIETNKPDDGWELRA